MAKRDKKGLTFSNLIIATPKVAMTMNHPTNSNLPEPQIVYVERTPSSWAWFTPFRVAVLLVAVSLIIFISYMVYDSQKQMEAAQQGIEEAEIKQRQAQEDLWEAVKSDALRSGR